MQQFATNGAQLRFHNVREVAASQASRVPNATAGAWLYSPDFYVGLSSAPLLGNQLDMAYSLGSQTVYSNRLERPYFGTAGGREPRSADVSLVPSVLVEYMSPAPVSVASNANVRFRELL